MENWGVLLGRVVEPPNAGSNPGSQIRNKQAQTKETTMVSPTDTNKVLLTGENNFMRLHLEENGPMTTRVGHWRILLSPVGPGHVLFLNSDLTDDRHPLRFNQLILGLPQCTFRFDDIVIKTPVLDGDSGVLSENLQQPQISL